MESDAKVVIQTSKEDDHWSISPIISNIKGLLSLFSFVEFSFISTSFNGLVHKLDQLRYLINRDILWG